MSRYRSSFMVLFAAVVGFAPAALAAPSNSRVSDLLTSAAPSDVATGLRSLAGTPSPGLEDALYVAAQRPEAELSSAALDLLAQTGDPRAVDLLVDALRSLDPARVSVACVWLPQYGALGLDAAERLVEVARLHEAEEGGDRGLVPLLRQDVQERELRVLLARVGVDQELREQQADARRGLGVDLGHHLAWRQPWGHREQLLEARATGPRGDQGRPRLAPLVTSRELLQPRERPGVTGRADEP